MSVTDATSSDFVLPNPHIPDSTPKAKPDIEALVQSVFDSSSPQSPVRNPQSGNKLSTPEFKKLQTPHRSHTYEQIQESPSKMTGDSKRGQKRLLKSLAGKLEHTLSEEAVIQKDTDRIRQEKIQPDEKEIFVVESPSGKKRGYKRHKEENPQGKFRLYPAPLSPSKKPDPSVQSLPGPQVLSLLDIWKQQGNRPPFKSFVATAHPRALMKQPPK
ncbi:MAG: hypothetical protein K1X28_09205 [Parachlamydiales bacterium]|nr:hypothetical protein [Parachlamydiales bacterium]